jgi:hypothetical protein
VLDADRAYRLELASVLPSLDMAHFDEMLAVGAAAALAVRVQRLRLLARPDQTPHDRCIELRTREAVWDANG